MTLSLFLCFSLFSIFSFLSPYLSQTFIIFPQSFIRPSNSYNNYSIVFNAWRSLKSLAEPTHFIKKRGFLQWIEFKTETNDGTTKSPIFLFCILLKTFFFFSPSIYFSFSFFFTHLFFSVLSLIFLFLFYFFSFSLPFSPLNENMPLVISHIIHILYYTEKKSCFFFVLRNFLFSKINVD